ncbi:MAG TPA: beta-ketoacyl-ACP synthase III [Micropepsaceae bacterium]|nr:beta-ketoacyl-ACP synthase III [Micropepsaceae bacterium]
MAVIRSRVAGHGMALPPRVVTNDDLARIVDTNDAWIAERTGIRQRYIADPPMRTSDLAYEAAVNALASAGLAAADIDLIVLATTTPDDTFPSTATVVQSRLGMTRGAAFDVQAVCSGFIYALSIADNFIRCGQAQRVLVIGAEMMSRLLDWTDRATCVLFGDGAGAFVLEAAIGHGTNEDAGILSTHIYSDGTHRELLYVDGGPGSTGTVGKLRMQGKEVFRHAVVNISNAITASLAAVRMSPEEIDWFVPHQANQRILDGTARRLGVPAHKLISTIAQHGNTSAASVPLAFATAVADGRIQRGQLLMLEAMGGGFTWGSALLRY